MPIRGTGTLDLTDPDGIDSGLNLPGSSCSGTSGYDDIAEGTQVVITDDARATL